MVYFNNIVIPDSRVQEFEDERKRRLRLKLFPVNDPRLLQSASELETRERYEGDLYDSWLSKYIGQRYHSRLTRRLYSANRN